MRVGFEKWLWYLELDGLGRDEHIEQDWLDRGDEARSEERTMRARGVRSF